MVRPLKHEVRADDGATEALLRRGSSHSTSSSCGFSATFQISFEEILSREQRGEFNAGSLGKGVKTMYLFHTVPSLGHFVRVAHNRLI